MNEFDLIEEYFLPLTEGRQEALGLKDDAAVLSVPDRMELVVTSDTLNEGVHFLPQEEAAYIAHKSLRVNLSDLASMGAQPFAYQLNIAFPGTPEESWVKEFTAALAKDQKEFGIFCCGGDTTSTKGPLCISITAMGLVPKGDAVKRSGANPGDKIVLSGPVGDAFIGLEVLRGAIEVADKDYFAQAYRMPEPRTEIAKIIRYYASAAADISDGFIADLGHICSASRCWAKINLPEIKLSDPARVVLEQGSVCMQDLLTGGDDYELVMAVPAENIEKLLEDMSVTGLSPQIIGEFADGSAKVTVIDKNKNTVNFKKQGWKHF